MDTFICMEGEEELRSSYFLKTRVFIKYCVRSADFLSYLTCQFDLDEFWWL